MNGHRLTGRIGAGPSALLHEEVLAPQFSFEAAHLLPWYVQAEQAVLAEYRRLGVLAPDEVDAVAAVLATVSADALSADPAANMSDIAFAVELYVTGRLARPVPRWHVDRSRNDLQATAQLMAGRARLREAAEQVLACGRAAAALARRHVDTLMPGYTHLQPAQVSTAGFYLAALVGELLDAARRLLAVYGGTDRCPLGAGAMTGQELAFDRDRLADLLGFAGPHPHPLAAVAARTWVLEAAGEASTLGIVISRFVTDLMAWGSAAYRFLDLPDELAGISSAMPQKKNFPVLERIRGRAAHLLAGYVDVATTQRATPFSNSVEVAKEGGAALHATYDHLGSALRLLTTVLEHAELRAEAMRAAVEGEYLGGFALANLLTLRAGIPWRTAQVVAGAYIVAAADRGLTPASGDPELLQAAARQRGWAVPDAAGLLAEAFDPDRDLYRKTPTGSTHPAAVAALLDARNAEAAALAAAWRQRRDRAAAVPRRLASALSGGRVPRFQDGTLCEAVAT
jgi:argininosuccinate lyase